MNSHVITVEVADETFRVLEREGQASDQSPAQLATALVEEWRRMQEHPGITFRPGPAGRRAGLVGGSDVWEVARVLRELNWENPDDRCLAEKLTGQSISMLDTAYRYYTAYRSEIDDWIARNDAIADAALAKVEHDSE